MTGLMFLATGVIVLVVVGWTIATDRLQRFRCRNWPKVSAVIDIVSVARIEGDSLIPPIKPSFDQPYYRATLTYTFNNPEQQIGDYSRDFGNEENAKAWANSYKGETVSVRVDPNDPTCSILREEDL